MKIYILQKLAVTPANAHFVNVKAFDKPFKAIKFATNMGLIPIEYKDKEHFLSLEVKKFARVKRIGLNDEKVVKTDVHQIIEMEVF